MQTVDRTRPGRYVPQPDTAAFVASVFLRASSAMIVAGLAAMVVGHSPRLWPLFYANGLTWVGWLAIVMPLALAIALDPFVEQMSVEGARFAVLIWSLAIGTSLATLVRAAAGVDIVTTLFATAAGYGMVSLVGASAHAKMGRIGMMTVAAVTGILGATSMNLILRSGPLETVIAILGVGVFSGLAAFDIRRIERLYEGGLTAPVRSGALR